jgi:heme-degrading monooxygenase HmoA
MIIEVAAITVKPGHEAPFEAAVGKAVEVFRRATGCKGLHLQRCIEEPGLYEVIIRWETLENHTVDFRGSELFTQWRGLVGEHFASPPVVRHFAVAMQRVDF